MVSTFYWPDALAYDPMGVNLIQVTSAAKEAVGAEGEGFGSGVWMFAIMAVVFIFVLKFGRKKPHIDQTVRSKLNNEETFQDGGNSEDRN